MNPIDLIEKYISEHGSAAILRDHVALLREQISVAQQKTTILETKSSGN